MTTQPHPIFPRDPRFHGPMPATAEHRPSSAPILKVVHVMLSLDVGGLERNVVNQVRQAPRLRQQVTIVCLERPGALARQVEELGAVVIDMKKRPGLQWRLFSE